MRTRYVTFAIVAVGLLFVVSASLLQKSTQGSTVTTGGTTYYVSPKGNTNGDGSIGNPWDLQTALAQPPTIHPGDTILVRGGTYNGRYLSMLTGTSSAPITVKNYPGERPTLDGINTTGGGWFVQVLGIRGGFANFSGLDITNTDPQRWSNQTGPWPSDIPRQLIGVRIYGNDIKFINNYIHDAGVGLGIEVPTAPNVEVYGNLLFYNGWDAPDRGHGHGLYGQNATNTVRLVQDNISFANMSHGFQIYGSDTAPIYNFTVDGNILFNNGIINSGGYQRNLLVGGGGSTANTQNPVITNNYTYYSGFGPYDNFGYSGGCTNATIDNNYFASGGINFVNCAITSFKNNTVFGTINGLTPSSYPTNTYLSTSKPTGQMIAVRPNKYEPGRANIVAYNWNMTPTISVDVSKIGLNSGDQYAVYDVQNIFGSPVTTGTYNGTPITIPMNSTTVMTPAGAQNLLHPMVHTTAQFGAFVIMKPNGTVNVPPGTPAPVPSATVTPTSKPVVTPVPTNVPSTSPSATPTPVPTVIATPIPTPKPTIIPTPISTPIPTPKPTTNVITSTYYGLLHYLQDILSYLFPQSPSLVVTAINGLPYNSDQASLTPGSCLTVNFTNIRTTGDAYFFTDPPHGTFISKNTWCATSADANKSFPIYGRYTSTAGVFGDNVSIKVGTGTGTPPSPPVPSATP